MKYIARINTGKIDKSSKEQIQNYHLESPDIASAIRTTLEEYRRHFTMPRIIEIKEIDQ